MISLATNDVQPESYLLNDRPPKASHNGVVGVGAQLKSNRSIRASTLVACNPSARIMERDAQQDGGLHACANTQYRTLKYSLGWIGLCDKQKRQNKPLRATRTAQALRTESGVFRRGKCHRSDTQEDGDCMHAPILSTVLGNLEVACWNRVVAFFLLSWCVTPIFRY